MSYVITMKTHVGYKIRNVNILLMKYWRNTSPKFESELNDNVEGINELVLDLSKLEYISSAGLRVLLTAQKIMNKQGKMIVRNTSKSIKEIFEMTGFSSILTIE